MVCDTYGGGVIHSGASQESFYELDKALAAPTVVTDVFNLDVLFAFRGSGKDLYLCIMTNPVAEIWTELGISLLIIIARVASRWEAVGLRGLAPDDWLMALAGVRQDFLGQKCPAKFSEGIFHDRQYAGVSCEGVLARTCK